MSLSYNHFQPKQNSNSNNNNTNNNNNKPENDRNPSETTLNKQDGNPSKHQKLLTMNELETNPKPFRLKRMEKHRELLEMNML